MARLRLATWNLLHGMAIPPGRANRRDLREAAKRLDADILAVQEVDAFQTRSGGYDQVAEVAAALDAPWFRMAPTMQGLAEHGWSPIDPTTDVDATRQRPLYGIGLISRFEVLRWSVRTFDPSTVSAPLLVPGQGFRRVDDEPRAALLAEVVGPEGPFTVVATHLSFIPASSIRQLRAITSTVSRFPRPHFLLGDLNLPGRVPRRVSRWQQLARTRTYPSWRPRVQWDHVLATGVVTSQVRAIESHALPVSDHCGLTVDIDF